jgi:hypothetical protein
MNAGGNFPNAVTHLCEAAQQVAAWENAAATHLLQGRTRNRAGHGHACDLDIKLNAPAVPPWPGRGPGLPNDIH